MSTPLNVFATPLNVFAHFFSRLRDENVVRVKIFIAQLLEPEKLLVGNFGQMEGGLGMRVTDIDSTLDDSSQREWPKPHEEEKEEGEKGRGKSKVFEETKKLYVGEASHVAIEDGEISQSIKTSHSLLKSEKSEASKVIRENKFLNLDNSEKEKPIQGNKGGQAKCDCKDQNYGDKKSKIFHIATIHSNMEGCQVCKRAFSSSVNFKQHMRSHHGRSCECPNILDMDEKQVLFHNQTVHRKHFGCNICYRTFRKKAHGLVHMAEHKGERGFQCDKCGNDYKRAGDLKSHTKLCLDIDPVKCDLCERHFKGKQRLKLHRRRFHVDLHQCPDCPKQVLFVTPPTFLHQIFNF